MLPSAARLQVVAVRLRNKNNAQTHGGESTVCCDRLHCGTVEVTSAG